ncbi:MAG TPA: mycothiol synthase [Acidimicrobiales bacterium]|jgi:mycothiol synthase|nr:mycothiol synthase [Acidimicrobiales bacterium]
MEIVVAKEPPKGFDLSITVPSQYPEELLIGDLNQIINPVTGSQTGNKRVQIWLENAQENHTEQLKKLNLHPYRDLLQMRCQLPTTIKGLETRPFRKGNDETSFLKVNSRAFHWHPEQGTLNIKKLIEIFEEDWFEEEGFRLYEIADRLAGFCWTKIHATSTENIGEIFAIAVDPKFHGKGLGKPLTVSGLQHIASKGITTGMLYVESDNLPAIHIYNQIGFTIHAINRAFHNQPSK